MGNVCSEISERVSNQSIEDLKNSYSSDMELLSYDEEYFNPITMQSNESFSKYKLSSEPEVKAQTDLFEDEVSNTFSFDYKKNLNFRKALIDSVSSSIPKSPFYDVFYRRLQAICATYEAMLRQDKLRDRLRTQELVTSTSLSAIPVSAQLGLSFGISSLLLMLKRSVLSDPDLYTELIQETSGLLAQFEPMSCIVEDPCVEKGLDKVSGFFESILKGEFKAVNPENQLASISPLLGIALITGNVTAAFSIIVKFFNGIPDKAFAKVLKSILPLIRALNKIAMSKPVSFFWDKCVNCNVSEDKFKATATADALALTEGFKKGVRFYELVLEKAGEVAVGLCDSENVELKITYAQDGSLTVLDVVKNISTYSASDKLQILVDMDNKLLNFYKNKTLVISSVQIPFNAVKVTCWLKTGSEVTLTVPEIPENLKAIKDLNVFEDNSQIHQMFGSLQNPEHPVDASKQNSLVVGAFLLALIRKNNEKHLESLEKLGKSAKIKAKELLSLDVRQQSLEYLNQILNLVSSKKMDHEITTIAITSTLRLTKCTLLASKLFPFVKIEKEFLATLYATLNNLFTGNFKPVIKMEVAMVMGECFEVFFATAEEQMPYLQQMILSYKNSLAQSPEELKIAESMIKNVSSAFGLFDAFSFEYDLSHAERLLIDLLDLSLALSVKTLKEKIDLKPAIGLLETCLKCLVGQYARSNFPKQGQPLMAKVTLKLLEVCTKFTKIIKKDKIDPERIKDSIISTLPSLYFTSLTICRFDVDFMTLLLEPSIDLLSELKSFPLHLPQVLTTKMSQSQTYESDHPYRDNSDTSKTFKVPYAEKYTLTFDSQSCTESSCDTLKLYTDESKSNLLYTWSGNPLPVGPFEVNSPLFVLDFHSDSSQTYWGFKVTIDALTKTKVYQNYWPSDLVTALQMFFSNCCKKLIRFEFEQNSKNDELRGILNLPFCKFGIRDKVLGLIENNVALPDKLAKLAGKEGETAQPMLGINKKLIVKESRTRVDLASYVASFGKWERKYSDVDLVEQLIGGSENVISAWRDLKQAAGIKGPATNIGGTEMNQAERAVFAVYISVFDITETVSKTFANTTNVSNSIKYLVKQSCNIRTWAQKRKQELIDSGKIVTYSDICTDVVEKCGLILHSEYRKGLLEAGVSLQLVELTEVIKDHNQGHVAGSKWKTVKGAMATMQKLGGLLSVSKPKVEKKDYIEISKVWGYLLVLLNHKLSAAEILKLLEQRRIRGLTRAVGYKYFNKLVLDQISSEALETFNQCVRDETGKIDMTQGLECTDPLLISCVQSTFFSVYKILMAKVADFTPESIVDLYFLLNLLESINYPVLDSDLHYFYDLNVSGIFRKLLEWAKGNYSGIKVSKVFSTETCVTSLKLLPSPENNSIRISGAENVHLALVLGESKDPITEFVLADSVLPGYEDSVGPVEISSTPKYLLIKRAAASSSGKYLKSLNDILQPDFQDYSSFLTQEDPDEKLKILELKEKVSQVSFKLLKLLMNSLKIDDLQETIIHELFKELKPVRSSYSLSLDETCKANTWLGKINFPTILQRNPMERALRKIYRDSDEGVSVRKIIESHVRAIDHGMKGVLKEEDEEMLAENAKKLLKKHPEFRNSRGEIDFFTYLKSLAGRVEEFDSKSKEFLNNHPVFMNLPQDFYEALELSSLQNVSAIIMYALSLAKNQEFINFLGIFIESETPGIASGTGFPEEFKNSEGNYDFYLAINKIVEEKEKFADWFQDVSKLVFEFDTFPTSCLSLNAEQTLIEDYQGTILFLIYAQCSSPAVLRALSRKPRVQTLFSKVLSDSQELSAFSYLILGKLLPSQHSFETLLPIWKEISKDSPDFLTFILSNLGRSTGFNLSHSNWKKLKRSSMDSFEVLKNFSRSERWRGKIIQFFKEEIEKLNKRLETGETPTEIQAGVIHFLAMTAPAYSGLDSLLQPLTLVKLEQASVAEGLIWSITDETCNIFSLESETFHVESNSKIIGVSSKFEYFSELASELMENLLQTWKNIQNFKLANIKLQTRQLLSSKLVVKRLESLVLEALISISDKKQGISRAPLINTVAWKKLTMIKELMASRLEMKIKEEATKQLSEEEIQARITALDEKNQIMITEIASLGYPNNLILAAMDAGCTTSEDIVENILGSTGPKALFSLKKWQDSEFDYVDLSESSIFYQKNKGHVIIQTSSSTPDRKVFSKQIDDSIFHSIKWFIDQITILICISGSPLQHKCEFGVKIGDFEVKFESVLENTKIEFSSKQTLKLATLPQYVFKIFACSNGELELVGENFTMRSVVVDESVFNGVSVGNLTTFIKEGSRCELKGFSIYEGRVERQIKFFEEDLESKEPTGSCLKPRIVESNYLRNRLQLMGLPSTNAKSVADQFCDLDLSIQELLKQDSTTWSTPEIKLISDGIFNIKIFDSPNTIEKGYEEIQTIENNDASKSNLSNRKVICIRKSPEGTTKTLSEISLEEIPGSTLIGELLLDSTSDSQKLYATFSDKPSCYKDLALVVSKTTLKVMLPPGYMLLSNKEGSAINLANKSEKNICVFLAYTTSDYLLSTPVHSLASIDQPQSTYGLWNVEQAKDEKDDSGVYKEFSLLELVSALNDLEEKRIQSLGKDFMLSISYSKPEALVSSAESKGVSYLLNMFSNDYQNLAPFLNKVLADGNKNVVQKIIIECISQLITAASKGEADDMAKVYESPHSYSNNMDVETEISFPGATKLVFNFDPQCYTESSYDFVAFYRKPGKEDEIKKYSGMGSSIWLPFEFIGNKVYMVFHSDGSTTYWGYKFTVKPVLPARKKEFRKVNIEAILFIIEFFGTQGYSVITEKFFKREIILPLFVMMFNTNNVKIIDKVLNLLPVLIKSNENYLKGVFEILIQQGRLLKEKITNGPNPIFTSILSVLCKLHESGTYLVKEKWFCEFYNCYYDIKDFRRPSGGLEQFLFENFESTLTKPIESVYESQHPYNRECKSEFIKFPGATYLQIVFDPSSALEDGDEIYFSSDAGGSERLLNLSEQDSSFSLSETARGPDIVLSNNNMTVTRTNSNGWGMATSEKVLQQATTTITISIDNTGDGEYLYIGLMESSNTNYTIPLNNDQAFKLWAWKKNGDFFKTGESTSKGANYGFNTGDIISLTLNFSETSVYFYKNNELMHSYNDLADKVTFGMSFGGNNQVCSLLSCVCNDSAVSNIKKRKFRVDSDRFYLHFPVNSGIYDSFSWESNNESTVSVSPLVVTRTSGEGPSVHLTALSLLTGRHFCEFEFTAIPDKTIAVVFLAKETIDRTQAVYGHCACYKNTGNILVGPNTVACKGFKAGETIGVFVDYLRSDVKFYKNKMLVSSSKLELSGEPHRFGVMLTAVGQSVRIVNSAGYPDDVDMIGIKQQLKFNQSSAWGYKFKVVPVFSNRAPETLDQVMKYAGEEDKKNWKNYYMKFQKLMHCGAAEELVALTDEIVTSTGKASNALVQSDICPTPANLIYYKELEKIEIQDIQELFKILSHFNKQIASKLQMFDLNIGDNPTEFQKAFLTARNYIFFDIKKGMFTAQLDKTKNDSRPEIVIDRTKAIRNRNLGKKDIQGQFSVFGQVLRAMNGKANSDFRNGERIFKVTYRGEGAIDAGGPYNEVISNICDELQSDYLPILVPTQNHLNNTGEARDAWVVNTKSSENFEEMVLFLGKIFGVAIRTQNNLNLSLAPLAWKKIVADHIEFIDLKSIDEICFQMIDIIRNLDAKGINKDNFLTAFSDEVFTTRLSNNDLVDLMPNGGSIHVTYENCLEYAKLTLAARLNEANSFYTIIRKGMSAVIPMDLVNLFSWKQVETLVCGAADIKIDILRANTEYSNGANESDPHITYFWEVLTEMTPKERQLFLKFVWGRSRLPASKTFTHMKITKLVPRGPVDSYLPVTHTCFFTIDLPPYNSKAVMKDKLLYAITHCTAIDLDTTPTGGWEEGD